MRLIYLSSWDELLSGCLFELIRIIHITCHSLILEHSRSWGKQGSFIGIRCLPIRAFLMESCATDNRLDRASNRNFLGLTFLVHIANTISKRGVNLTLASKASHTGSISGRRAKVKTLLELPYTATSTFGLGLSDPSNKGIVSLVNLWKRIVLVDQAICLSIKATHWCFYLDLNTHVLLQQEITVVSSMIESTLSHVWRTWLVLVNFICFYAGSCCSRG